MKPGAGTPFLLCRLRGGGTQLAATSRGHLRDPKTGGEALVFFLFAPCSSQGHPGSGAGWGHWQVHLQSSLSALPEPASGLSPLGSSANQPAPSPPRRALSPSSRGLTSKLLNSNDPNCFPHSPSTRGGGHSRQPLSLPAVGVTETCSLYQVLPVKPFC